MSTLADLRTRAYQLMDEGQSQYLGLAEMNNYVNNAASLLHNIVIGQSPWRAQKEFTWAVLANVSDYALPADFRDSLRVFTKQGTYFRALQQFNASEFGQSSGSDSVWRQASLSSYIRYRIMGSVLKLDPAPTTTPAYSLVMWYTPQFTPLVLDADALPSFQLSGHEQWIINQAVIYAKTKEEVSTADLSLMNAGIMAQIMLDIGQRDRGEGNHIVLNDSTGWSSSGSYGGRY